MIEATRSISACLAIAAAMASHSRHPYSQAIAADGRLRNVPAVVLGDLSEHPGAGLEGRIGGMVYRLGRSDWALLADECRRPGVVLSANGRLLCSFCFEDKLRPGARDAVAALVAKGVPVEILSGDHEEPVRRLASALGVPCRAGGVAGRQGRAHRRARGAAGERS